MEQWLKIQCPACHVFNWVNNGDPSDMTVADIDSVRCWKCKVISPVDEEIQPFESEQYGNCYDGLRKPI